MTTIFTKNIVINNKKLLWTLNEAEKIIGESYVEQQVRVPSFPFGDTYVLYSEDVQILLDEFYSIWSEFSSVLLNKQGNLIHYSGKKCCIGHHPAHHPQRKNEMWIHFTNEDISPFRDKMLKIIYQIKSEIEIENKVYNTMFRFIKDIAR